MGQNVKKLAINKLLLVGFLLIIFFVPLFSATRVRIDYSCLLSFGLNGFIFIIGIYQANRKHSISMELIYWLFMFFFMYFAPVIQYRLNIFPWSTSVTPTEAFYANVVIFVFNIVFLLGCFAARKIKFVGPLDLKLTDWLCSGWKLKNGSKMVLSLIVVVLAAYSFSKTGFSGIVVSRTQAMQIFYSGGNSAIELVVESFIPAFVAYIVAESAQSATEQNKGFIRFAILFLCMLICFFPTAIPRYKVATIYGVVFLALIPALNKGQRFFWIFTIGLFVIYPLLSTFRYVVSHEGIQAIFNEGFFESYTDGNYDTWRMLVSAIRYNTKNGCTFGRQLLGVLLFFIPSSLWSSKPIGSGGMLIKAEQGNDVFSNVSCPFVAEGFVNFGFLGVIVFGLFLGYLITKLDKKYWDNFEKNNKKSLFSPYLFLVFMLFFVMRGDLLSGFAYLCGFIVTGFILKPFTVRT